MKVKPILAAVLLAIWLPGCGNDVGVAATEEPAISTAGEELEAYKLKDEKEELEDFMQETPDSTCFSRVGYYEKGKLLIVEFRESGDIYEYSGFSDEDWETFIEADSLGGYFNDYIKDEYPFDKIY